jgi:hypothetical protein
MHLRVSADAALNETTRSFAKNVLCASIRPCIKPAASTPLVAHAMRHLTASALALGNGH